MSDDALKADMLQSELKRAPLLALHLLGEDAVKINIAKELDRAFNQLADPNYSGPYKAACPITGASEKDYCYRILSLTDSHHFLCGIHFEGLNLKSPFIQIAFSTFD